MTEILELVAELRTNLGKGGARSYRKEGKVPAIIYGNNKEPMLIAVESNKLNIAYNKSGFMSKIIELNIGGKKQQVVARDIQLHPVTDMIEHADFAYVDNKAATKFLVSLKYTNADKSMGIKRGGKLNVILRDIYVVSLAKDAPKYIEVDLSKLNIGSKIKENDLILPKGVKLFSEKNRTVVTINGRGKSDEAEGGEQQPATAK